MNRFNQPTELASYKPLSFQELAFAPTQLRQREDRLNDARDAILHEMNNIVGYEGYDEETNAMKAEMQKKLNGLADSIQKNGAGNINYSNEFRNLRNDYNKLVSKTGALGMSSALKESIDSQKEAYFKMALERGQDPKSIEANWQREIANHASNLPKSLKNFQGQLPALNLRIPPKRIDEIDYAIAVNKLMGEIKDVHQKVTYEEGPPDKDGVPTIIIKNEHGEEISNSPQIEKFKEYMKLKVLDPSGELAQDLEYRGSSVEDFLKRTDVLGDAMLREASLTKEEEKTSGGTGGTKSRSSSKEEKEDPKAELVATDYNASETIPHTESIQAIDTRLGELKTQPDSPERNREIDALTQERLRKQQVRNDYLESEGYENKFKNAVAINPELTALGINTIEDFEQFIKDPKNNEKGDFYRDGYLIAKNSKPSKVEQATKIMNDIKEELYNTDIGNNPAMAPSQQYTFNMSEVGGKSGGLLGKVIPPQQVQALMARGMVEASNQDLVAPEYATVDVNNEGRYSQIMGLLQNPDAEYTFAAINSGSAIAPAEIMYTVKGKIGDETVTEQISIKLDDNSFTRSLLSKTGDMYKSLDATGQRTIDAIRDNIVYGDLAVSDHPDAAYNPNAAKEMFRPDKTTNIVTNAAQAYQEDFKNYNIQDTENPVGLDKHVQESLFIKPQKGVEYSVVINEDKSYSTYKKDADGKVHKYTFEDLIKRDFMAQYATKHAEKPNVYSLENLNLQGAKLKADHRAAYLIDMLETVTDINQLNSTLSVYGASPKFEKGMQRLYGAVKGEVPAGYDRTTYALKVAGEVYEDIKAVPVRSKNKRFVI